jgi:ATP-dependent protease ClpP protease subunit
MKREDESDVAYAGSEYTGVFSGIPEIPSPPWIPEVPSPFAPEAPKYEPRSAPLFVPMVDDPRSISPRQRLYEQRRVLATGVLDSPYVSALVSTLMALDGLSEHPNELVVSGPGGPISSVLVLLDVIGLMRARVDALCIGPTSGTATALAVCVTGRRRITSLATLSLRDVTYHAPHGPLGKVSAEVKELGRMQTSLGERVAAKTSLSLAEVLQSFDDGLTLSADDARNVGLVDEVVPIR